MALLKWPDWATTDIADIGNGDPNKQDPGATKQADGWEVERPKLQHMNWIQNLFGKFIRNNNEIKEVATTYEAEAGQRIIADNSAAAATINLPTTPLDGQWVEVGGKVPYSTYAVVVKGGTIDIMVAADSTCILDLDDVVFRFYYNATENLWKIRKVSTEGKV